LLSIGHIARLQRLLDNDANYVTPEDMLAELRDDNKQLVVLMRQVHELASEHNDYATTSLLENWIDQAERRTWVSVRVHAPRRIVWPHHRFFHHTPAASSRGIRSKRRTAIYAGP
jgi:hypothetical protein